MKIDDMILVSVDDHISEPPEMFDQHIPAKYKDRAPKLIRQPQGDVWVYGDRKLPNIGLNAVAGRTREEYGMEPNRYEQMRKGVYDVNARIDDMNVNGVLGSLNFSSMCGFSGQLFLQGTDKELDLACLKAYNDWHIDEWCGAFPGRFLPLGIPPIWDPALAVEEIKRLDAKGCHAISLPPNPAGEMIGLPSLHNAYWDPVWKICDEIGTVICMHIGAGGPVDGYPSEESPVDVMMLNMPVSLYSTASDIMFSPILRKYDNIKIALSEGGIGWIPYFLERLDHVYEIHHHWTRQKFPNDKPSDLFRKHIITCFIDDATGLKNRDDVGIDKMTWECDYPHSDSSWPYSPEALLRDFPDDITDEEINKITHLNTMREFNYDPFSILGRENCTVGALRAQAGHVDTTPVSQRGGMPPTERETGPITRADTMKQMAAALD